MNGAVLKAFRSMAYDLPKGETVEITIQLRNGTLLKATFDPLFKTVTLGGFVIPWRDLPRWTKMAWGSQPVRVVEKLDRPVPLQAEN